MSDLMDLWKRATAIWQQKAKVNLKSTPTELVPVLMDRLAELEASSSLRCRADMRVIARWRSGHPEREPCWPDHADLAVWLLCQLEEVTRDQERVLDVQEACLAEQMEREFLR